MCNHFNLNTTIKDIKDFNYINDINDIDIVFEAISIFMLNVVTNLMVKIYLYNPKKFIHQLFVILDDRFIIINLYVTLVILFSCFGYSFIGCFSWFVSSSVISSISMIIVTLIYYANYYIRSLIINHCCYFCGCYLITTKMTIVSPTIMVCIFE
jgi:hypothetical protein